MERQNDISPAPDFLATDIADVARHRGGPREDLNTTDSPASEQTMARAVGKRLLPACVVVPAVLWWALIFGQRQGYFDLETAFVLFVFSVAAVFGVIVCLNLRRLARMDAQRAGTEEQLKLAKESAEAANRFRSAFFASISHEIRTPLTAINGFAELMLNPQRSADERLADARIIRRNGEHLLTLINDILDLSKIEAGRITVDPIVCSPVALIGEACAMLRQRATEKGLSLDITFETQLPTTIRTDPTRLRQILLNLLSNAIKFTKQGGVTLAVSITPSFHVPEPRLEIKITDTGIGIPAERLANLFQPFVQGDASITRQYGGSGLGLAISRHFARALGGEITVTSEPGRGSTFIVTVETGTISDVPVLIRPEEALELQDSFTGPQARISGSILVAEDGIDNQALIAARLRQTGLRVEIAPNGQLACERALEAMANDEPFDLILMDVQMPVMDGFTATHHLRGKGYRGPIIALTANAMERDREKCLNAGCNDFVTKPIQLDKLFKAIGRHLVVEEVSASGSSDQPDVTLTDDSDNQVEAFYAALPEELADLEETIDREDRVRLRELMQLILGKAAAAGLRDVAAETAKLHQLAEVEPSWAVIRQAVRDFAREAQPSAVVGAE